MKNVEKASATGKFNPTFGLANSGIAGTGLEKEDEDQQAHAASSAHDEEVKDVSKKEHGNL